VMTKSSTAGQLGRFFNVMNALHEIKAFASIYEVQDFIHNATGQFILYDTLRLTLNELYELQLVDRESRSRKLYYKMNGELWLNFSNDELLELITAVRIYRNMVPYTAPGYYLEQTLDEYIRYARGVVNDIPEHPWRFKHRKLHSLMEEDKVYQVIDAIEEKKDLKVTYYAKSIDKVQNLQIKPIRLVYNQNYGTWLFAAWTETGELHMYRIDRVQSLEIVKSKIDSSKYSNDDPFRCTWGSVPLIPDSSPNQIRVTFRFDDLPRQSYIIQKIEREMRFGKMTQLDDESYEMKIDVSNTREIKPWLFSLCSHIKTVEDSEESLNQMMIEDLKELKSAYEELS